MAPKCVFALLLVVVASASAASKSRNLKSLHEENWRTMLKGEWMIEFYAPWCPACKDLSKAWSSFADWSKDLEVNVAEVDVTQNPGLSGRFLVTALPTIYHVKDGVFRLYSGPRDKEDFIGFVEEKKWTVLDPLPGWKYPDSAQMAVVAAFFKLSMSVRDAHNYLVEKKNIPVWGSYLIFAVATLLLGCILGFFIVCIIDVVFPSTKPAKKDAGKDKKKKKGSGKKDEKDSDKEEESDSAKKEGGGGDVANGTSSPNKKKKQ